MVLLIGFRYTETLSFENVGQTDLKHFILFADVAEEVVEEVGINFTIVLLA